MADVRKEKESKYAYLKPILKEKGYTKVTIGVCVIGSLGSWDPANEEIIKTLRINQGYISNTIEDSQAIQAQEYVKKRS